ncbi:MAG TPA: hypothetical protein VER96_40465 [Polyangiaceae bacterium]|nr:hypothetical protein [Polyangiaceae bacterium]
MTVVDVAVFCFGRWINDIQRQELFWVVAEYAQPWATLCFVIVVLLAAFAFWRATFAANLAASKRVAYIGFAGLVSLLSAIELGMGIYYDHIRGEFRISELMLERTHLEFRHTTDDVFVCADLNGFFTWRLNENAVHPRLLPLPLDDGALKAKLSSGTCRGPETP